MDWISVEDRLPEKDGIYFVYSRGHELLSFYSESLNQFAITHLYNHKVTHWMPLPGPPE